MIKNLKSASQFGGAYVQVVAYREWVVATRVGGLQVFSDRGGLQSESELALLEIPLLKLNEDGLFAVFKKSVWSINIDRQGTLSLERVHNSDMSFEPPRGRDVLLDSRVGRFALNRKRGSVSTPTGEVRLSGYSRPSGMAFSSDFRSLFVADMGAIHRIEESDGIWHLGAGGYECWGWPKDIACEDGNVFVANVLGISWYREIDRYPYLELQDRISKFHFRIAKVVVRNSLVYACDEARGLHVFRASDGKLKPAGGVFVEGGGWDFCIDGIGCFLASGTGGWRRYKNLPEDMTSRPTEKSFFASVNAERIQGVACWPNANAIVVMSSAGVSVLDSSSYKNICSFECNAWSGAAAGNFFLIASSCGLVGFRLESSNGVILPVSCSETEEARDVTWDGEYFWIADGKGGVKCYSIARDGEHLEYQACFPVCGFSRGLCKTKSRIYVGAGDGGLVVINADKKMG